MLFAIGKTKKSSQILYWDLSVQIRSTFRGNLNAFVRLPYTKPLVVNNKLTRIAKKQFKTYRFAASQLDYTDSAMNAGIQLNLVES